MLEIVLVPLNMGRPTYGPYRVREFIYKGNSTSGSLWGGDGYQLNAHMEDGGALLVRTGSANGLYCLQCKEIPNA